MAVQSFIDWSNDHHLNALTAATLDESLSLFALNLLDDAPLRGQLQILRCTIHGIEHLIPELSKQLVRWRQSASELGQCISSKFPPPLSKAITDAMKVALLCNGKRHTTLAIHIAFSVFLRAIEVLGLRVSDL